MIMLSDALTAERETRQRSYKEVTLRRQLSQEVLRQLAECLTSTAMPRWYFIPNGDEIVVVHNKGAGARQRVGAWTIDDEHRLSFGAETTEWITPESWSRVIDKAVMITARMIVDAESETVLEATMAPPRPADGDRNLRCV
jgi:hypothetical protein